MLVYYCFYLDVIFFISKYFCLNTALLLILLLLFDLIKYVTHSIYFLYFQVFVIKYVKLVLINIVIDKLLLY